MIIATKKCERLGLTITNDFFSQAQLEGFTLSFLLSTDNVTRSFALLLLYCLLLCYIVLLPHKVSPLCFTWPLSGACPFWGAFLVTGCFVYFIHLVSCSSSLSSSFPFFFVHLQLLQTATKAQSTQDTRAPSFPSTPSPQYLLHLEAVLPPLAHSTLTIFSRTHQVQEPFTVSVVVVAYPTTL